MVLQDTWLFEGSVADNIAYGNPEATKEEIIQAARDAQCHHFIRTLPNGYDTIISSDGSQISQGQQQLLTIARAILADPQLLILDEATSSVDTRTEGMIQQAMDRLTAERTSFVIAHRLSTIKNADLILVMKDGSIIEQGSHRSLMKKVISTRICTIVNLQDKLDKYCRAFLMFYENNLLESHHENLLLKRILILVL